MESAWTMLAPRVPVIQDIQGACVKQVSHVMLTAPKKSLGLPTG